MIFVRCAVVQPVLTGDRCPQVKDGELKPIIAVFGERDDAIRLGIHLDGVRYEVSGVAMH